jgi:hypothetical protein
MMVDLVDPNESWKAKTSRASSEVQCERGENLQASCGRLEWVDSVPMTTLVTGIGQDERILARKSGPARDPELHSGGR